MPNMHIHASLTSAMRESEKKPENERIVQRRKGADLSLLNAHAIILMVIRSQNDLFSLCLEYEIEACEQAWCGVWLPQTD